MKLLSMTLAAMLVLAGCGKTYEVEMSVEGGQMHRTTTIIDHAHDADSQPTSLPTTEGTVDGIGESSRLLHYETSMGQTWMYLERVRGNDSPAEIILQRFRAADTLADLLLDYAAKRYGKQREFPKLKAFIDQDLRKDMKNLATWTLLSEAAGTEKIGETSARIVHYLLEHNYLTQDDVPTVFMLFNPDGTGDSQADLDELGRHFVMNKIGLTDKAFIDDLMRPLPADDPWSFDQIMQSNPAFRQSTRPATAGQDDAKTIQPSEYARSLAMQIVGPNVTWMAVVNPGILLAVSLTSDHVRMSLAIEGDVVISNGVPNEMADKLKWEHRVGAEALGSMHYAVWAKPDDVFQTKHFGKAVLKGVNLTNYCLWRKSLTPSEGKKWDDFLATLKPGAAASKLEVYQETLNQKAKSAGRDTATHFGARLLLDALELKPTSQPTQAVGPAHAAASNNKPNVPHPTIKVDSADPGEDK